MADMKKNKRNKKELILSITSLILFFAVWQIVTQMNQTHEWFNPKFLPAPTNIFGIAFGSMTRVNIWN